MRTLDYEKNERETPDPDRKPAELGVQTMFPENPFAAIAYEWNNALRIAVEKMWRD